MERAAVPSIDVDAAPAPDPDDVERAAAPSTEEGRDFMDVDAAPAPDLEMVEVTPDPESDGDISLSHFDAEDIVTAVPPPRTYPPAWVRSGHLLPAQPLRPTPPSPPVIAETPRVQTVYG